VVNATGSHALKFNLAEKYIKTTKALKGKNILLNRDLENIQFGLDRNINNILEGVNGKEIQMTVIKESWSDKIKKLMK
jgi:hypothetical protein